jgi:hypothetical protein
MSQDFNSAVAVIGIDIGKNSFQVVGLDDRGAIMLRQKWWRGQIEARLANVGPFAFTVSCSATMAALLIPAESPSAEWESLIYEGH